MIMNEAVLHCYLSLSSMDPIYIQYMHMLGLGLPRDIHQFPHLLPSFSLTTLCFRHLQSYWTREKKHYLGFQNRLQIYIFSFCNCGCGNHEEEAGVGEEIGRIDPIGVQHYIRVDQSNPVWRMSEESRGEHRTLRGGWMQRIHGEWRGRDQRCSHLRRLRLSPELPPEGG